MSIVRGIVAGVVVASALTLASSETKAARAAFPGRNGRIAFVRAPPRVDPEGEDIFLMNADGSRLTRLTSLGGFTSDPVWTPDGKRIAFDSTPGPVNGTNIFVMNADGSGQTNLTHNQHVGNARSDTSPTWSPDGKRIAFSSYDPSVGNAEILVMNADGSGRINLTNNAADDHEPAWSPDGSRIAFARDVGGNREIFVMNVDGSGQTDLTNNASADYSPAWSPDGRRIVFGRAVGGKGEIFVMNADGSRQSELTHGATSDFSPAWSPDGRRIVFSSGSPNVTDGTGRTKLTNDRNVKNDYNPDWQPLARSARPAAPPNGTATGTFLVNGQSFTSGPVPFGSKVDVTHGRLTLKADVGTVALYGDGTDTAQFTPVRTSERIKGKRQSLIQFSLIGGDFSVCGARRTAAETSETVAAKRSRRSFAPSGAAARDTPGRAGATPPPPSEARSGSPRTAATAP